MIIIHDCSLQNKINIVEIHKFITNFHTTIVKDHHFEMSMHFVWSISQVLLLNQHLMTRSQAFC